MTKEEKPKLSLKSLDERLNNISDEIECLKKGIVYLIRDVSGTLDIFINKIEKRVNFSLGLSLCSFIMSTAVFIKGFL